MKLTLSPFSKILLLIGAIAFLVVCVISAYWSQEVQRLKREVRDFERWRIQKNAQMLQGPTFNYLLQTEELK